MHSNSKPLAGMVFQYVKLNKSVMCAISGKSNEHAEWRNILQLMYHMRQALACALCGRLVFEPHTPIQEPCHCVCSTCQTIGDYPMNYNCATCKLAFQSASQNGFQKNKDLNYAAVGYAKLCRILIAQETVHKWSNLQASDQIPITFSQLIQEGADSDSSVDRKNLSDKFRRQLKQKKHQCRCGSGSKKNDKRGQGSLICLGQRCACYKEGKACVTCKCVGCKNPN